MDKRSPRECFRHSFKPKSNLSVAPLLPRSSSSLLATAALEIVASPPSRFRFLLQLLLCQLYLALRSHNSIFGGE